MSMMGSLVVMILGAATYLLPTGSARELGRVAFFVGLFWLVYIVSLGHPLHLHAGTMSAG